MIKLTLLLLLVFCSLSAVSQKTFDNGYIGVGIGPSFLINHSGFSNGKVGTGLNLNLLNFSYSFTDHFAISTLWSGGAHLTEASIIVTGPQGDPIFSEGNYTISYGVLMLGPSYSFKISKRSKLNLNLRVGSFYWQEDFNSSSFLNFSVSNRRFSYNLGVTHQYNFAKRWCVLTNLDLATAKISTLQTDEQRVTPISITTGVGFKF